MLRTTITSLLWKPKKYHLAVDNGINKELYYIFGICFFLNITQEIVMISFCSLFMPHGVQKHAKNSFVYWYIFTMYSTRSMCMERVETFRKTARDDDTQALLFMSIQFTLPDSTSGNIGEHKHRNKTIN